MKQAFYSRVRIRAVTLILGSAVLAGAAAAQADDRAPADRDALKLKLQEMDISREQTGKAISRRAEFMRGADANADGVLTMVELESALKRGFYQIDRNSDGEVREDDAPRLAGRERFLSHVTLLISERDVDGDGGMSLAEFSGPSLTRFSLMDEDGDGRVNLDAIVEAVNAGQSQTDT